MTYDHAMNGAVLLDPKPTIWQCPMCDARHTTDDPRVARRTHPCPNAGGIDIPMQRADRHGIIGHRHHVALIERGDYIGDEMVQHGPTMAVQSYRPDGSYDTTVFAPTGYTRPME